jgi:hypothetical protein
MQCKHCKNITTIKIDYLSFERVVNILKKNKDIQCQRCSAKVDDFPNNWEVFHEVRERDNTSTSDEQWFNDLYNKYSFVFNSIEVQRDFDKVAEIDNDRLLVINPWTTNSIVFDICVAPNGSKWYCTNNDLVN